MTVVGPTKTCEYCKAVVREADYADHLAVTHRLKTVPGARTMPPAKTKRKKGGGGGHEGNSGANWWSGGA